MQTSYKNKFYNKNFQNSTPIITVNSLPVLYKGYNIYKRFSNLFDIVKNGICVGMCAGLEGAKRRIDTNDLNTKEPLVSL
jgi:hypothetical protein